MFGCLFGPEFKGPHLCKAPARQLQPPTGRREISLCNSKEKLQIGGHQLTLLRMSICSLDAEIAIDEGGARKGGVLWVSVKTS